MAKLKVKVGGAWKDLSAPVSGGGGLPATGQTTSYRTGDDGDIEAGIPLAGRFVDNGNGTVTDNATGLMWRKYSMGMNQTTGSGSAGTYTWNQAVDFQGNSHAGYSDWRLPNLMELLSIVAFDTVRGAPYTYQSVFPNTVSSSYWSSTTRPAVTSDALYMLFNSGRTYYNPKTNSYYVRLVRQI